MAGLGYKDFTAGAVLTAAQVDGYLMEQAVMNFAGTAARNSALSSVQSAGMMAHVGAGTVTVYDGSAWQQVYPAAAGLTFITSAALTGASVSVNNCFSSTYANYRIIVARSNVSTAGDPLLRLRLSGTDATTNYTFQLMQGNGTTASASRSTAQTSYRFGTTSTIADDCAQIIDLFSPAIAASTFFHSYSVNTGATPITTMFGGAHTTATAYDGITFLPSAGNWSAGTVSIYGYR